MRTELPAALVLEFPGAGAAFVSPCGAAQVLDSTGVFVSAASTAPALFERCPIGPAYGCPQSVRVALAALANGFTPGELAALGAGLVLPLSPSLFLEQRIRAGVPRARQAEAAAFAARVLREGLDAIAARPSATARQRALATRVRHALAARGPRPLRVTDLARALDCSLFHLIHTFRRVEGTTICAHHAQLRLRGAAITLAEAPGADLSSLALDFGFSSHSHFTAAFRRAFGMTPSALAGTSRRIAC